jgi:hypothetical protein
MASTNMPCGNTPHGTQLQRFRYKAATPATGTSCVKESQTQTCNNGMLSPWSGTFMAESCSDCNYNWNSATYGFSASTLWSHANAVRSVKYYVAFLNRSPDLPGLKYWNSQSDTSISLIGWFLAAPEAFKKLLASSNGAYSPTFVTSKIYPNTGSVLDAAGGNFWLAALQNGYKANVTCQNYTSAVNDSVRLNIGTTLDDMINGLYTGSNKNFQTRVSNALYFVQKTFENNCPYNHELSQQALTGGRSAVDMGITVMKTRGEGGNYAGQIPQTCN